VPGMRRFWEQAQNESLPSVPRLLQRQIPANQMPAMRRTNEHKSQALRSVSLGYSRGRSPDVGRGGRVARRDTRRRGEFHLDKLLLPSGNHDGPGHNRAPSCDYGRRTSSRAACAKAPS